MKISEIYASRQGEGLLTGTESVFVRTSGCNLRCDFCDTPFTSWEPEGTEKSLEEIVRQINYFKLKHVVITGGEPMLPSEIIALTKCLSDSEKHLTIETAGTIDRLVHCDLMSISPKLSNSTPSAERAGGWRDRHEAARWRPKVIRALTSRYPFQLKFVVKSPDDLIEVNQVIEQIGPIDPSRILLMPEGVDARVLKDREAWIRPLCEQFGFRFSPRMHIAWFGNTRGT